MTYKATAINIMIASPSDVSQERILVRNVIEEWNAVNAQRRKIILMPVGWESHSSPEMGERPQGIINKQILKDCDLLIAMFWARIGSATGQSVSGTVEEIEEHLKAGKPAMLYFSSVPVRQDSVDSEQYEALKRFRGECRDKGLVEEYESLSEFRGKVSRHLAQTVIRKFSEIEEASTIAHSESRPRMDLSESAKELLVEASHDRNGVIMRLNTLSGTHVQTNGRDFVKAGDRRSSARWRGAVDELNRLGLVEDRGGKGEVFSITHLGYELVDEIAVT